MIQGIIAIGLSSFAITYLLKYVDGPFDVFARIRRLVKLELPVKDTIGRVIEWKYDMYPDGFFARLFNCFWCLTTWVALICSVVYIIIEPINWYLMPFIWLASVGLSGYLHDRIGDGQNI